MDDRVVFGAEKQERARQILSSQDPFFLHKIVRKAGTPFFADISIKVIAAVDSFPFS